MSGPLNGVRILDLTTVVSGPLSTMLMGDQGADVIKIENPAGPDVTRMVSQQRGGFSASYLNNNRSKKSVTLNLKDKRGIEILNRLALKSDVMIQNFRPGVVERLGIGPEDMLALNPKLVYVSISGFGDTGPFAKRPVYDPLVQALSGLTTVQGGSDDAHPELVKTILPDKLTGYVAAQAVSAALYEQEKSGQGQHIKVSMLDAIMAFLWSSDMSGHTLIGAETDEDHSQRFIDMVYETTDGYITAAVNTDRQWQGLCRAMNAPQLLCDERFKTPALRAEHIDERLHVTAGFIKTKSTQEWLELLHEHDVPCAPVLNRSQAIEHPQVVESDIIIESEHPIAGKLRQTRPAAVFSRTKPRTNMHAPALGEHTRSVLEEAGYGADMIDNFTKSGVI